MFCEGCVTFAGSQGYDQSNGKDLLQLHFFSKVISFEDLFHFSKQVPISQLFNFADY